MDIFIEQIIVKRKSTTERLMQSLILLLAGIVIAVLVFITITQILGFLSMFAGLIALGVGYSAFRLTTGMNIEYEYSVTNGIFDIDKIIGQRNRKRIISINCSEFNDFGKYDESKLTGKTFDTKIIAANIDGQDVYYGTARHKDMGRVLIIFEPNDKVLAAVKKFLPRQVAQNAFGGN